MARALRVEFPGAIYHVTVRMLGDARSQLFVTDRDRTRFLAQLEKQLEDHEVRLYAFCLMRNHYHLLAETPRANLGRFMHDLKTAYSGYYNIRHSRHGHLYDGRYGAKLVEGDEYLLTLSRYIHLNPIWTERMRRRSDSERLQFLKDYRWSRYHTYTGIGKSIAFVEKAPLLAMMSGSRRAWPSRYKRFVLEAAHEVDDDTLEALKESPLSIGSESFRRWVEELYQELVEGKDGREDVSFRRVLVCLDPEQVLEVVANELRVSQDEFRIQRHGSVLRGVAAKMLCRFAGLTQRKAGELLGLKTGAAVSLQLKRLAAKLDEDRKQARRLKALDTKLAEMRRAAGGKY